MNSDASPSSKDASERNDDYDPVLTGVTVLGFILGTAAIVSLACVNLIFYWSMELVFTISTKLIPDSVTLSVLGVFALTGLRLLVDSTGSCPRVLLICAYFFQFFVSLCLGLSMGMAIMGGNLIIAGVTLVWTLVAIVMSFSHFAAFTRS